MADETKDDSAKRRHTLFHNKTLMAPLNDAKENPKDKSRKRGWVKNLFGRKKESEENTKDSDIRIDYSIAGNAPEPNFLMDIDAGKSTGKVEPELALWLNDGRIVKSVEELAKALKTMKGRAFTQHQENNELRDWVRDITGNAQLAAEIAAAKTKNDVIKALENKIKESRKKKKEEPAEKREIQKAIEEIKKHPRVLEKSRPLEEREKLLKEMESQLETEEDLVNKKRLALANRRYQLIKERGELEKEKFERIEKHHSKEAIETGIEQGNEGMPEMSLEPEYTKDMIQGLISQAREELSKSDTNSARKTITKLKSALECAAIEPQEIKKIEYDILELEADLKLALLA